MPGPRYPRKRPIATAFDAVYNLEQQNRIAVISAELATETGKVESMTELARTYGLEALSYKEKNTELQNGLALCNTSIQNFVQENNRLLKTNGEIHKELMDSVKAQDELQTNLENEKAKSDRHAQINSQLEEALQAATTKADAAYTSTLHLQIEIVGFKNEILSLKNENTQLHVNEKMAILMAKESDLRATTKEAEAMRLQEELDEVNAHAKKEKEELQKQVDQQKEKIDKMLKFIANTEKACVQFKKT